MSRTFIGVGLGVLQVLPWAGVILGTCCTGLTEEGGEGELVWGSFGEFSWSA